VSTPLSPICVMTGGCVHTAVTNLCNDTGVVSTPLSPICVMTGGCVHTAVTNLCSDTGVVSTPPSLLYVAPSRAVSLGDSTVAVKRPILRIVAMA